MQSTENISVLFYKYLWAYILVALSGCLGNVVDGIIVGNLINEDGVSAINLSRPLIQFIFTLHLLINAGAGMLVGYALGKKQIREAGRFFTSALVLSSGIGILLSVCGGLLFPGEVARLLCKNEELLPQVFDYTRVLLLGNPLFILMWGLSTMVGVDDRPRLVSLAVIVDNAVNLCLDIVFIQAFGWGITGSSAATVVGHLVGISILLCHWWRPGRQLIFSLKFDGLPALWPRILSQGAPLSIASVCLTLLMFSANSIVLSTLGRVGIFAFALCMNLLQIYNLFLAGVNQTLLTLGAIQVGKGNDGGLRVVLKKAFRFISISLAVTCLFTWIAPQAIVFLFGGNDPELIAEGTYALRVLAFSFIPFCYIDALMIVYKLYGQHFMALFISFALSLTVIPVLWLMSWMAPGYLWYSFLIAYLIEAGAIFVLHRARHVELKITKS